MRFVDDDHVPTGGQRLLQAPLVLGEETEFADEQLIVEERVRARLVLLDGDAPALVEDVEPEVEAPQQLEEPLVDQRFRHDDQDPLRAAGQQQPVQDEAGLDRLAEANLVGEQHARQQATGHLGRDAQLMRQQVDAASGEAAHGRLAAFVLVYQRRDAQREHVRPVELTGEQPRRRAAEAERVAQRRLADVVAAGPVDEEAVALRHRLHDSIAVRFRADGVADAECGASQWGIGTRDVLTRLASGRERERDRARADAADFSEAELGFTDTDPALAGLEGRGAHVARYSEPSARETSR